MKNISIFMAFFIVISASPVVCAAPYVSLNMGAVLLNDSEYSNSGTYYDGYSFTENGEFHLIPGLE